MFDETKLFFNKIDLVLPFEPEKIPSSELRDGLVVRTPNWLGDLVMTIPAMYAMRKMLPRGCGLFIVVPKGLVPVVEAMNAADEIIPLSDAHAFPTAEEKSLIRSTRARSGILFNNSFRDALALRLAGVRHLYGTAARFRSLLLKRSFSFPKRLDGTLNAPHQASRYLAMARAVGAEVNGIEMPEMTPLLEPEITSDALQKLLFCERLLVLACGAAYGDAKRWKPENFNRAASYWLENYGGMVAAVGSDKEAEGCSAALSGLDGDRAVNMAGKTNLHELMAILKHSDCIVANDSGVMHLAAAMGRPGIGIFGSTDYVATGPVSEKWLIAYRKLDCSPCFRRVCPLGTKKCFEALTPELITAGIDAIMEKKASARQS